MPPKARRPVSASALIKKAPLRKSPEGMHYDRQSMLFQVLNKPLGDDGKPLFHYVWANADGPYGVEAYCQTMGFEAVVAGQDGMPERGGGIVPEPGEPVRAQGQFLTRIPFDSEKAGRDPELVDWNYIQERGVTGDRGYQRIREVQRLTKAQKPPEMADGVSMQDFNVDVNAQPMEAVNG